MTRIINLCKGWGCDLAAHCNKHRYIPEAERDQCYIHEFIPTTPGESCPEFESKKHRRWGDGRDTPSCD